MDVLALAPARTQPILPQPALPALQQSIPQPLTGEAMSTAMAAANEATTTTMAAAR